MKETKFIHIEGKKYKDGIFSAGLIKNSSHKSDHIYLHINDWYFHLRDDEAFAIISALANALWCGWQFKYHNPKMKWKTLKQLNKTEI